MAYIDIRIEVSTGEPEEDGYVPLDVAGVKFIDSDLDKKDRCGLSEMLFQSDFGQIDFPNAIFGAIDGQNTSFD